MGKLKKFPNTITVEAEVAGKPLKRALKLQPDGISYRLAVAKGDRSPKGALKLLALATTAYDVRKVKPAYEDMDGVEGLQTAFVNALIGDARNNAVALLGAAAVKAAERKATSSPRQPPVGFGRKKAEATPEAEVTPEVEAKPEEAA
jgi:hypothetical protein